jgi:hypothetical protein
VNVGTGANVSLASAESNPNNAVAAAGSLAPASESERVGDQTREVLEGIKAGCRPEEHIVAIATGMTVTEKGPIVLLPAARYVVGPGGLLHDDEAFNCDVRVMVVRVGAFGTGAPGVESISIPAKGAPLACLG